MVTGLEACRRHGIRRGPGPGDGVHLLVTHSRQAGSTRFVTVERTKRLPAPVIVHGFPMTDVTRATTDASRRLTARGDIAELLSDAVQRGLCTVSELGAELEMGSRKGTATPRAVLAAVGSGVRSAAELDAKRLWPRTGLPEPWWNASVFDEGGKLLGVADCWVDDVALVWEIESSEWHMSPADHDRSVARAARFASRGALLVPTKPRSLRLDPAGVVQTLRDAYGHAATRPRPSLHAIPQSAG